ncbi:hypothetical protein FOZ60_008960 [Perkinsus olseni]|uniref:Mei2-like C-terminal RNA recognition motif domain-containing protein n=3 Tax=Perkinsus olseni TaxID=32597 RepID=A0A7J6PEI1_PEROL|nr:hypothetical protein FOZ60_008960 [Perkinsus olseni]
MTDNTPQIFRVRVSDLGSGEKTEFVRSAADIVYAQTLADRSKQFSRASEEFTGAMKQILDRRFGEDWNVCVGFKAGYALKSRKKESAIVLRSNTKDASQLLVVCWRSPAFEILDREVVRLQASEQVRAEEGTVEEVKGGESKRKVKVLQQPQVDDPTYSSDTTGVIEEVTKLAQSDELWPSDKQDLAIKIRQHLSARFGPCWHILTSDGEIMCRTADKGVECSSTLQVGKTKVIIFRHIQPSTGLLASLSPSTLAEAMPTIMMVLLALVYIYHRGVCSNPTIAALLPDAALALCPSDDAWFTGVLYQVAGAVFVLSVVRKVMKVVGQATGRRRELHHMREQQQPQESLVINPAHGGGSSGSPASRTKSSLDDTSPPRQGSLARPLLLPGVMPRDGVITPPEFDENKAADMDTVGLGLDEVLGYYARQMAKIRTDMLAVSASQAVIEATTESDVSPVTAADPPTPSTTRGDTPGRYSNLTWTPKQGNSVNAAAPRPPPPPPPTQGDHAYRSWDQGGWNSGRKSHRSSSGGPGTPNGRISARLPSAKMAFNPNERRTTLLMRNVPNDLNQEGLVDLILKICRQRGKNIRVNFFYAPMDSGTRRNLGYCFVNLQESIMAKDFEEIFTGLELRGAGRKRVDCQWAVLQGFAENVRHYKNSSTVMDKDSSYWPLIFGPDQRRQTFPPIMPDTTDATPSSKHSYPGNGTPMTPARPKGRIPAPQSIRIVGTARCSEAWAYSDVGSGCRRQGSNLRPLQIDDEGHSYSVADCSFGDSTTAERILSQRKHVINGFRVRIERSVLPDTRRMFY